MPVEAVLVPEFIQSNTVSSCGNANATMGSDVLVGSQYLFDSETEQSIPGPFQY